MAAINATGFTATQLSEYLERIRANWRLVFGSDLSFDADTPQAELTGIDALLLTQFDEVLADLAASLDIYQATGQQLDNLCSILSIARKGAIHSNVNALMTGVPLSVIPAGVQAKLSTGEIFSLKYAVTLDGDGEGTGFFEADDAGPIPVGVGTLTHIVTPAPGWETVNNESAGATGEDAEQDFTYRRRYFLQLAVNAVTPIDSIVAGVFALDGVTDVAGFENDTDAPLTIEGVEVPAHSVAIAVSGGSDAEVAARIRQKKTLGCGTHGTTTVDVPVYLPNTTTVIQTLPIKFFRVEEVAISLEINITPGAAFPDNGEILMKQYLLAYFNGSDQFTSGFELDGYQIAESVFLSHIYTPVNRVPGHVVNSIILNGDAELSFVEVLLNQKATLSENDITITTS